MRAGPMARSAVRRFDGVGSGSICRRSRGSEASRDQLGFEKIIAIDHGLWFSSSLAEHGPNVGIDTQHVQPALGIGALRQCGD